MQIKGEMEMCRQILEELLTLLEDTLEKNTSRYNRRRCNMKGVYMRRSVSQRTNIYRPPFYWVTTYIQIGQTEV